MKFLKEPDLYLFLISLAVDMLTFFMTDDTIKGSAAGLFSYVTLLLIYFLLSAFWRLPQLKSAGVFGAILIYVTALVFKF